jgi:hypothetical protein
VVSIVIGSIFIVQAVEKNNWMKEAMRSEKVTLGLSQEQIAKGEVIDTAKEAQAAADTIREHRHKIAPTYNDLLKGGQYDPTNPQHLTYSQAINMENYLYLAVLSFGVTTVIIGTGVFMIITGFALGTTGVVLLRSVYQAA